MKKCEELYCKAPYIVLAENEIFYVQNFFKLCFPDINVYFKIMGEPSNSLMEEMAKTEADRVAKQRESLGEPGLIEKATILDHATEENEVDSFSDFVIL